MALSNLGSEGFVVFSRGFVFSTGLLESSFELDSLSVEVNASPLELVDFGNEFLNLGSRESELLLTLSHLAS